MREFLIDRWKKIITVQTVTVSVHILKERNIKVPGTCLDTKNKLVKEKY